MPAKLTQAGSLLHRRARRSTGRSATEEILVLGRRSAAEATCCLALTVLAEI